jgi:hypothetical protein
MSSRSEDSESRDFPATDQAIRADATPSAQRQPLAPPAAGQLADHETRRAGQWS